MAYVARINGAQVRIKSIAYGMRFTRRVLDSIHDIATRGARGGPYSTGKLAASIYKEGPVAVGLDIVGSVGSNLPYATIVERGARVHSIFPKNAPQHYRFGDRKRPQLRFIWRGRLVFAPHIPMSPKTIGRSHPGQSGKHFMLKAAVRTSVRFKMKLYVYSI